MLFRGERSFKKITYSTRTLHSKIRHLKSWPPSCKQLLVIYRPGQPFPLFYKKKRFKKQVLTDFFQTSSSNCRTHKQRNETEGTFGVLGNAVEEARRRGLLRRVWEKKEKHKTWVKSGDFVVFKKLMCVINKEL